MGESRNTPNVKDPGSGADKTVSLEDQTETDLAPAAPIFSSMSSTHPEKTLRGYSPSQILSLQRTIGNKAVQRMVERTRQAGNARLASTDQKPAPASALLNINGPDESNKAKDLPVNGPAPIVQRLMSSQEFIEKSRGPLWGAFSGKRDKVTKVEAALTRYTAASSKSVALTEVISACDEYLKAAGKKGSSRVSGVKALKKEATDELAAWRLRARVPLPASVYRSDERKPDEIAKVGFQPWNKTGNVTIVEHVKQVLEKDRPDAPTGESGKTGMGAKKHSQWVSTAGDLNFAKDPTLLAGLMAKYFYKIDTQSDVNNFHDVSKHFDELGIPNPYETQFEFCKAGGIPGDQVTHYVEGKDLVDFVIAGTDAASWNIAWKPMPRPQINTGPQITVSSQTGGSGSNSGSNLSLSTSQSTQQATAPVQTPPLLDSTGDQPDTPSNQDTAPQTSNSVQEDNPTPLATQDQDTGTTPNVPDSQSVTKPLPTAQDTTNQPQVQAQGEFAGINNYIKFSDDTNLNPVFKLEFASGKAMVIKYQGPNSSAGEILAGKFLGSKEMKGINTPEYRVLTKQEEAEVRARLLVLATAKDDQAALKVINTQLNNNSNQMLAMDFMENASKKQRETLYATNGKISEDGRRRLENIGKLYAFQFFVKGYDRFISPDAVLGSTIGGNTNNVMMSGQTTDVQAIDTTLDVNFHKYKKNDDHIKKYLETLRSHVDELIFNPTGNDRLTKTLEGFLAIPEMDEGGREAMRKGILSGISDIGSNTTDFKGLIASVLQMLPPDAQTDFNDPSFAQNFTLFLESSQAFFSEKAELIQQIQDSPKDLPKLRAKYAKTNKFIPKKLSAKSPGKSEKKAVISPTLPSAGEVKKDTLQKSDSVFWYQWSQTDGYVKQTRSVKKGTPLKTVRPVPDEKFKWAETLDEQSGYLHSKNLKIKTLGPPKTPDFVDKNSLLEPVEGTTRGKNVKDTNREWFLDQAVLMEAYRNLQEKEKERLAANDPEGQRAIAATQKQLALAMLQSFAKSAPVDQNVIGDPLGVQSNPTQGLASYHRSGTNPLLDQLRGLLAKDMQVSMTTLQVLSDPLFMDVLNREFPVYNKDKEAKNAQKVDTNIDSLTKFESSIDALLTNFEAGHAPEATFVFNVTAFYNSLACRPDEVNTKLTRPLENVLLRKAAATVNGKDPQPLVDSILNHIQLVIITRHKGVDVLVVPKLFKPLTEEEKKALSQEELALRGKADEDERNVFMEAGGHDSRKLDSSMIESGSRMDPITAKEALLNFATPQQLLESSKLTSVKLATKGTQNFTVCKDINDFLKTASFQKFRQLSTEKDAPPYQKFYPEATADLLAGLAQVSKDQGGLDKVFENKQITGVLQHAYYRMLNAMAGASTYKSNLVEFMNNIELIHDQLQMVLAVAEPHAPETTFSEGIVKALRENTGKDDKPTLPQEISDPLVSHKASAMHSVASVLSSVEDQKEKAEGVRKLNALVLKDNYYEAHGAVENSKTYDVSVLDGWKLKDANGADQALTDQAFENGKKPAGPIDVFICDFHHNISVERSEYKVENLEHQVEELFKNGLVADKFTVAIDCTVDYIRSEDIKKFLEKHKNRITDGKMNVVLYRSAQKFDMLGMDNYYGGYTVTINDGKSYQAFNDRINKKEDQATGLSHQGMAHLVKFGSKHQDDYRTAIMENTKKLYDGLPVRCRGNEQSPLMIAKTEDPRNAFLDIQFPGRSELFAVGNTMPGKGPILEGFYVHFIKWAQGQNLAFTTRPSFGFSTTNFTLIAGSKVRLNPGLESEEALNKYIGYFTKVLQLLEDSEQAALAKQPKDTFASEKALIDFLDKVSDDALKTWAVPPIPTRNLGTGSPRNITGPETTQFNSNSGKVKTGQTPVATKGQSKSKKKTGGQSNDIPLPPQHPVVYGDLSNPNPFLYFEPNNNGGNNLRVDSVNPRGKWAALDQFCAYLATHWLTTGHNEGGLKFKDLDLSTRQKAVQTLYDWGGTGGLAAQEQYAIQKLTAQKITKNNVIQNAQNGIYNAGTKIWFGTDIHTQAAVVLANGTYNVYDPNTGLVKNMTGTAFATYANSSNVFIVA